MGQYFELVRAVDGYIYGVAVLGLVVMLSTGRHAFFDGVGYWVLESTWPGLRWVRGWSLAPRGRWAQRSLVAAMVVTVGLSAVTTSPTMLIWPVFAAWKWKMVWGYLGALSEDQGDVLSPRVPFAAGYLMSLTVIAVAVLDAVVAARHFSWLVVALWPPGGGGHHRVVKAPAPTV